MEDNKIKQLLKELAERKADYILVGAMALTMWGIVRATADVDLFLPRDAKNLERVKDALRAVWNDPEIDGITAADLAGLRSCSLRAARR